MSDRSTSGIEREAAERRLGERRGDAVRLREDDDDFGGGGGDGGGEVSSGAGGGACCCGLSG